MNERVGPRFRGDIRSLCYIGGLCRLGEAVSNRGGAGGGPQDTARPASVSELVIGETPGDSCGCRFDLSGVGTREPLTEVSEPLAGFSFQVQRRPE